MLVLILFTGLVFLCEQLLTFPGSNNPFLMETVLISMFRNTVSELTVKQNLSRAEVFSGSGVLRYSSRALMTLLLLIDPSGEMLLCSNRFIDLTPTSARSLDWA